MIFDDNSEIVYFVYSFIKPYVVGAHQNCLGEAILMSTHYIGFYEEITKIVFSNYHQICTLCLHLTLYKPWHLPRPARGLSNIDSTNIL